MDTLVGLLIIAVIVYLIYKKKTTKEPSNHKKASSSQIKLQEVNLENINLKCLNKLFVGQIVTIDADYKEDADGMIDDDTVKYNLITYPQNTVVGSLRSADEKYGEKYSYAILKSISENSITACVICEDVYLQRFKFESTQHVNNGDVLEVERNKNSYNVKLDGKNVGTINDERMNDDLLSKISYFAYDNGCAQAMIKK